MHKSILIYLALLMPGVSAQAGVIIGATRVVYGEKQSSVAVSLRNNSPFSWLINSKITAGGRWPGSTTSAEKAPFVITPPLFSLKSGRESSLRIIYTGAALPKNRESMFTLSIATIPSGKVKENDVQIAVRSQLKLFYRPAALQGSAQDAWRQLHWSASGPRLIVENPTPYYVTLFNLRINDQAVNNAGIVAPFSQRTFNDCQHSAHCAVRWQGINDYGRVMPVQSVDLQK